jgi:hypothetical protein
VVGNLKIKEELIIKVIMKDNILHLIVHSSGFTENMTVQIHVPRITSSLLLPRLESLMGN